MRSLIREVSRSLRSIDETASTFKHHHTMTSPTPDTETQLRRSTRPSLHHPMRKPCLPEYAYIYLLGKLCTGSPRIHKTVYPKRTSYHGR